MWPKKARKILNKKYKSYMVEVYRGRQMVVEVVSASEGGEGKET